MAKALGLIELRGLATAIVTADEMLKKSNVQLYKKYNGDAALTTILIEGDLASVKLAIRHGITIGERTETLISSTVLPRPDFSIHEMVK